MSLTHSGDYFHQLRRYFHRLLCTYLKVDLFSPFWIPTRYVLIKENAKSVIKICVSCDCHAFRNVSQGCLQALHCSISEKPCIKLGRKSIRWRELQIRELRSGSDRICRHRISWSLIQGRLSCRTPFLPLRWRELIDVGANAGAKTPGDPGHSWCIFVRWHGGFRSSQIRKRGVFPCSHLLSAGK